MIHEEICTCEVAKLAKEKGFDWDCPMFYNPKGKLKYGWAHDPMNRGLDMRDMLCHNSKLPSGFAAECTAPTQSLLQRWLREEKGLQIYIDSDLDFDDETFVYEWQIANKENFDNGGFEIHRYNSEESHSTYELALEDALKYTLENLV